VTVVDGRRDAGAIDPRPRLTESQELRPLLRRRLMLACLVAAFGFALEILRVVGTRLLDTDTFSPGGYVPFVLRSSIAIVVFAALWLALRSWNTLSLTQLRRIELIIGAMLGVVGVIETRLMFAEDLNWMAELSDDRNVLLVYLASSSSIYWMAVIVGYATFIPNSTRRSAVVIGMIAAAPVLVGAWSVVGASLTTRQSLNFLATLAMWTLVAAAIAIYGVRRVEVLREQVRAAQKLGPYRLIRLLGAGGMGEVYLAEHTLLRRPCAVKVIRPEQAGNSAVLRRFEREVQATAKLTNWHTVEIYDYGRSEDGTFYYAMVYLDGLTLQQLVDDFGPLPAERAVHFLRQVCEALAEAHASGLIHRDVKPGNIIVSRRGGVCDVVKLVDFGLVRDVRPGTDDRLTQAGTIAGSPAYTSPEQAAGRDEIDNRTDQYSLGAVGYFLLTGRPPFVKETAMQTLAARLYESPQPLSAMGGDVPPDLEQVVMRCLQRSPDDRFANVMQLAGALAACASADGWTAEYAAQWWRDHASAERRPSSAGRQ
jgi:serine/threonine-protein kinase